MMRQNDQIKKTLEVFSDSNYNYQTYEPDNSKSEFDLTISNVLKEVNSITKTNEEWGTGYETKDWHEVYKDYDNVSEDLFPKHFEEIDFSHSKNIPLYRCNSTSGNPRLVNHIPTTSFKQNRFYGDITKITTLPSTQFDYLVENRADLISFSFLNNYSNNSVINYVIVRYASLVFRREVTVTIVHQYPLKTIFNKSFPSIPNTVDPLVGKKRFPKVPTFKGEAYVLNAHEVYDYVTKGRRWTSDNRLITSARCICHTGFEGNIIMVGDPNTKTRWKNDNPKVGLNLPGGSTLRRLEDQKVSLIKPESNFNYSVENDSLILEEVKGDQTTLDLMVVDNPIYAAIREFLEEVFGIPEDLDPDDLFLRYEVLVKAILENKKVLFYVVGRTLYLVFQWDKLKDVLFSNDSFKGTYLKGKVEEKGVYSVSISHLVNYASSPSFHIHNTMRDHVPLVLYSFNFGRPTLTPNIVPDNNRRRPLRRHGVRDVPRTPFYFGECDDLNRQVGNVLDTLEETRSKVKEEVVERVETNSNRTKNRRRVITESEKKEDLEQGVPSSFKEIRRPKESKFESLKLGGSSINSNTRRRKKHYVVRKKYVGKGKEKDI